MKRGGRVASLILLALLCLMLHLPASHAQQPAGQAAAELVVGTKEAPPFAMKDAQGEWSGIGIELWKQIAAKMKRPYRFVEADSVASLLDRLEAGEFEIAVAAITVTPAHEQRVDFSWPYFQTGTGIAVQTNVTAVRVGVVDGTATQEALSRLRVSYKTYATVKDGFAALQSGRIDALAYDRPILAWMIRQDRRLQAELAEVTFEQQSYAIALRPNRPLRKEINVALLEIEQSDWWKDVLFRYLGQTPN